jgi:hypothetical protein
MYSYAQDKYLMVEMTPSDERYDGRHTTLLQIPPLKARRR